MKLRCIRDYILKLHQVCSVNNELNEYKRNRKYLLWFLTNVGFRLAKWLLMFDLFICRLIGKYPEPLKNRNNGVIVSLTSFPARINFVWLVVESIMKQHERPIKILLYLSEEEFPDGRKGLPKRLLSYEKLGLQIYFRSQNIMPHIKYYYALQEYPNCTVITVDDDQYYYPETITNLVDTHLKYPDCVCANLVRIIKFDSKGAFMPYKNWERPITPVAPALGNVALGFCGVLYPAGIFKDTTVFDSEQIHTLSLRADDLWLRVHETINMIPVVSGKYIGYGVQINQSQRVSLMQYNNADTPINGNDMQWKALCGYYNLSKDNFMR